MIIRINKYKDEVWQKAADFGDYIDHIDTIQFQKVCPWCGDAMVYDNFNSASNKQSDLNWTIGYILPLDRGGTRVVNNLQAIHVKCDREKNNDYTLVFGKE